MLNQARELLHTYFGYREFREGQEKIIQNVLQKTPSLAIMPTGGGKSICYQIPALMMSGVTIVISPLISLMKDQVDALVKAGIPATYINSALSHEEIRERSREIQANQYKLIYIAPERLDTPIFLRLIESLDVSLLAIDEAHCISQWGHDFRPSYLQIHSLLQHFHTQPVVLALTATATPQVQQDICSLLHINRENMVKTGFARENLHFHVVKGQNRDAYLLDYLQQNKEQAGIIYAATRKEVDRLHHLLKQKGVRVGKYHAGLSEEERADQQEQFLYDDLSVMVATNAFGMGINKSNVRYVIHYHLPRNMESYYQEAGRAGRDGEEGDCILLFSPQDTHIQGFLIEQSEMEESRKEQEYSKLRKMVAYGHTESCLQQFILDYFGEKDPPECGQCGNCTDNREQVDVTVDTQKVLSCIKRMDERFGKTMVAKVLTGSNDKKIKSMGFERLSTFAIMKEKSQKEVSEFIDFLTAEEYVQASDGAYPVLLLTEKAVQVLRGVEKVWRKEHVRATRLIEDDALFAQLRELRKEMAEREKVPPYIIFSDVTLREMSAKMPVRDHELLQIKGVGERKLETYGQAFLERIQSYMKEEGIEQKHSFQEHYMEPATRENRSKSGSPTHHITYQLLLDGSTIAEIASQRQLSERTIENHLIKCDQEGQAIDWEQFIPAEFEPLIEEAVKEADTTRLTPIKQLLPEEISFFMIRAYLQKQKV